MLSKVEIIIDFNGPGSKIYYSNIQEHNSESF